MSSFFLSLQDRHLVCAYIVVDDNSPSGEREIMQREYPHFQYLFKDAAQKGHARSLNLLQYHVKRHFPNVEFVFHLEDDWLFLSSFSLRLAALQEILQHSGAGQVLINEAYAEVRQHTIQTGQKEETPNGHAFYRHIYLEGAEWEEHFAQLAFPAKTVAFWPHYSLRPSLMRAEVWRELGLFNETHGHFELEYAHRYVEAGYFSVFLFGVNSVHLGKKTWEKDSDVASAYALNNETRFIY